MESLILVKYLHSHLWLVVTEFDSAILDGWASEEEYTEEAESTVLLNLSGLGTLSQAVWEWARDWAWVSQVAGLRDVPRVDSLVSS